MRRCLFLIAIVVAVQTTNMSGMNFVRNWTIGWFIQQEKEQPTPAVEPEQPASEETTPKEGNKLSVVAKRRQTRIPNNMLQTIAPGSSIGKKVVVQHAVTFDPEQEALEIEFSRLREIKAEGEPSPEKGYKEDQECNGYNGTWKKRAYYFTPVQLKEHAIQQVLARPSNKQEIEELGGEEEFRVHLAKNDFKTDDAGKYLHPNRIPKYLREPLAEPHSLGE